VIVTSEFRLPLDEAPLEAVLPARLDRPALRRRAEAAVAELDHIAGPAACYDVYPIEAVLHERLQLAGGTRIGSGPLASVVAGADELYVAVCTLGSALDERIREHRAEGRYFEMLVLDELGSWAVDQVRTQLYECIAAELGERGRHASSPLAPGESEWPIREQRIVFRLLDAARIDVALGAGNLMRPLKSLSFVFGAGASELGSEGLTRCHYCSIRDRCRYAEPS
jgi:hypothetical protein